MELPNRQKLESQLARRLERLNAKQRREVYLIIGNPPNLEKADAIDWDRFEREVESETMLAFYLIFMASAGFHAGLAVDTVDEGLTRTLTVKGTEWARNRARTFADAYARGAKNAVAYRLGKARGEASRRAAMSGEREFTLTKEDIDKALADAIGPSRAASAAENETTAAQNAGGDQAVSETVGLSNLDRWDIHPELSRGGTCGNCRALANVTRDKWQSTPLPDPQGHQFAIVEPGNAPGCNCTTRYANLPNDVKGAA